MMIRDQEDAFEFALAFGREQLYTTSPEFQATVHMLAQLLPKWVDALADGAAARDRELALQIESIRSLRLFP